LEGRRFLCHLAQETLTLERAVWSYRGSAKRKSGSIYAILEDNLLS
jgi:hypothetical protein